MSTPSDTPEYNDELLDYLQLFRGEGFLSPGGADETRRVLDRVQLAGKDVLEIGSGLGGCSLIMGQERGAASVLGLDVEPAVISRARAAVAAAKLDHKIAFRQVEARTSARRLGRLRRRFQQGRHVPHRGQGGAVRRGVPGAQTRWPPGGGAIGSGTRDGEYSEAMQLFVETTGLSFHLDSLDGVRTRLEQAGFVEVEVVNRNAWFREEARREAEMLEGPLAEQVENLRGKEVTDSSNECQRHMIGGARQRRVLSVALLRPKAGLVQEEERIVCGIAGRILAAPGRIGADLVELMDAQSHRGADSTGFAVYGPPRESGYVVRAMGFDRHAMGRDLDDFLHLLREHGSDIVEEATWNDSTDDHYTARLVIDEPRDLARWIREADGLSSRLEISPSAGLWRSSRIPVTPTWWRTSTGCAI